MTFVLSGLRRSGKPLRRKDHTQKGSTHALQALFPLHRRLLPLRGLLRKSSTPGHPLLLPSLQEGRLRVGGGGLGMHLVLRPVRLSLLLLDLGPARWVDVSLVPRPVRARALLSPLLLRELGRGELLVHSGRPLPAPLPRLPLPAHHSTLCNMVSRESLRRSAPILNPPVFPDLRIEEQGRIVGPALGRPALVTGPIDLALALLPARGQAVESVVGGSRLFRYPPASALGETGRGPRTATGLAGIALGVTGHCLRTTTGCGLRTTTGSVDSSRDPLLVGEVAVPARGHEIPLAALMTAHGHWRGRLPPLTAVKGWRTVSET